MSRVVAGFGVPHTPAFPALVENRQGPWQEIQDCFGEIAGSIADARLDALVVFSSDHFNTFFLDNFPTFAIGVAAETSGPNDGTPALPVRTIPVHEELAKAIHVEAMSSEFDLSLCQEFSLDHTFVVPLHQLGLPSELAIVPVFINSFVEPQPSSRRAFDLGLAVGRGVASHSGDLRVGALASGSFSLEVGGPRIEPGRPYGVPDPDWASRVRDLLQEGAIERLIEEATPEQFQRAGNAAAELLDWLAMLAATGAGRPDRLRMQDAFGHGYGSWSAGSERVA